MTSQRSRFLSFGAVEEIQIKEEEPDVDESPSTDSCKISYPSVCVNAVEAEQDEDDGNHGDLDRWQASIDRKRSRSSAVASFGVGMHSASDFSMKPLNSKLLQRRGKLVDSPMGWEIKMDSLDSRVSSKESSGENPTPTASKANVISVEPTLDMTAQLRALIRNQAQLVRKAAGPTELEQTTLPTADYAVCEVSK